MQLERYSANEKEIRNEKKKTWENENNKRINLLYVSAFFEGHQLQSDNFMWAFCVAWFIWPRFERQI